MTLKEKLSKIQQEMKVPKNLYNSFGKYNYRNAESILEAFKPLEDKYSVNYKPTKYDVKNQYGQIVKSAITEEAISAKTGVLSWNLANVSLLSTGVYKENKEGKKKDLIFTGDGKALKTVLLRAVHTKENGKKIRFTMIGQGGSGFAIAWENKEVTIDAELTAIKKVKGFLASFEEELTEEEAAAIVAA